MLSDPIGATVTVLVATVGLLVAGLVQALVVRLFLRSLSTVRALLFCSGSVALLMGVCGVAGWRAADFVRLPVLVFVTLLATGIQAALACGMRLLGQRTGGECLKVFATANGVLLLLILLLSHAPDWLLEDRALLGDVAGEVIIMGYPGELRVDVGKRSARDMDGTVYTDDFYGDNATSYDLASDSQSLVACDDGKAYRLLRSGYRVSVTTLRTPASFGEVRAVSPDCTLVCCQTNQAVTVYDRTTGARVVALPKAVRNPLNGRFSLDDRFFAANDSVGRLWLIDLRSHAARTLGRGQWPCFSRAAPLLAWGKGKWTFHHYDTSLVDLVPHPDVDICVMDLANGKKRIIDMGGRFEHGLAWSPNGEYLAYLGTEPNPITRLGGGTAVRVITIDGRRSATVCKIPSQDWLCHLLWSSRVTSGYSRARGRRWESQHRE